MCEWGTNVKLRVQIPADLSRTGKAYWRKVRVDACIATLVDALNNAGILTRQSCCGHGKCDGRIDLQDGRVLIIQAVARKRRAWRWARFL
jgi:hypothetical protein